MMPLQNNKTDKTDIKVSIKKAYKTPYFNSFGLVRDLTAAGSGLSVEQVPGQGSTTKRP